MFAKEANSIRGITRVDCGMARMLVILVVIAGHAYRGMEVVGSAAW
jgi:hypothetical protein